jgi:hypothetical protein
VVYKFPSFVNWHGTIPESEQVAVRREFYLAKSKHFSLVAAV